MAKEDAKARKQSGSSLKRKTPIGIVPVQKGLCMKGDVRQTRRRQSTLVSSNRLADLIGLIMKNKRDKVMLALEIITARFIDEDAQLTRREASLPIKKPGKTSPALGSPFYKRDYYLYTTNRNVESILSRLEHMFYTNHSGDCPPGRKAA